MRDLEQKDITVLVNKFSDDGKDSNHRYKSYDFCYSHFYLSKQSGQIDIEKSCFVLWSYLASWGMLRGSSFLLQKNPSYLKPLVEFIYQQDISVWQIDVDAYEKQSTKILHLYDEIRRLIVPKTNRHLVLVTKILLGVFGCSPAYDTYFCMTFRELSKKSGKPYCSFNEFDKQSLDFIFQFYLANTTDINQLQELKSVYDFNGHKTDLVYTKAKIIDMYGFNKSLEK